MKALKALSFLTAAYLALSSGFVFAQANTSLSNLSGTAINQSLNFDTDNVYSVGDTTAVLRSVYSHNVSTPNNSSGNGGDLTISTGYATGGSGTGGNLLMIAGNGRDGGGTARLIGGSVGASTSGNGGEVDITGGNAGFSGGVGGSVVITGGSQGGFGGDVDISPGTSNTSISNAGVIRLKGNISAGSALGGLPSVSSCGSSPSVIGGGSSAGRINVGGSTATCTITFPQPFSSTPACTVSDETARIALKVVPSTTTLVVSAAANFAASTVLDFICIGTD